MSENKNIDRQLNDEITEESLGSVIGGVAPAAAAAAPVARRCKATESTCTDATYPPGDWD
ncbi:MAG: hypothetical protein AAF799_01060 [Myxococcota bacterium]